MIIGISGKRGSGKDTLANELTKYGWERASFAKSLKAKARADFGLSDEQTDGFLKETVELRYNKTPRHIMIDMGQFYRSFDPLFWVKTAFSSMDLNKNYTISDVRFINEADYIRSMGGVIIRLNRDPKLNIYQGTIEDVSETQLDNYKFDYVVPAERNVDLKDIELNAGLIHRLCTAPLKVYE